LIVAEFRQGILQVHHFAVEEFGQPLGLVIDQPMGFPFRRR